MEEESIKNETKTVKELRLALPCRFRAHYYYDLLQTTYDEITTTFGSHQKFAVCLRNGNWLLPLAMQLDKHLIPVVDHDLNTYQAR